MSVYFQILFCSIIIPFIFSFHPRIKFYKRWPEFIKSNLLIIIPFLIWDEIFTLNSVWGFNDDFLSGIYVCSLPLEEILFFFVIPYCVIFTYEVFCLYPLKYTRLVEAFTLFLAIIILIIGVYSHNHIYTFITFTCLGILLFILFFLKKAFLQHFYITYFFITISFFLIVNGTLTGGTLSSPVVWYNDAETLNIRVWSIPIEDFFYSMLLLLSNISLYEFFKHKKQQIISL